MPKLTKHAEQRLLERVGTRDKDAKRNAGKAFNLGIKHRETRGELRGWLNGKYLLHKKGSKLRIYKGRLYVFENKTLITVYPIPEEYDKNLEYYVDPVAYTRYLKTYRSEVKRKTAKEAREQEALRTAFHRRVLLDDIRGFAEGRFPVDITGVGFDGNKIRVYYIPIGYKIADLSDIAVYIKEHTYFRSVKFCHVIDDKGKHVFHNVYNEVEENELVYRVSG